MFNIEVNGLIGMNALANSLITNLKNNGFSLVNPTSLSNTTYSATLETMGPVGGVGGVNPVADAIPASGTVAQKWRIRIETDNATAGATTEALSSGIRIFMGTELQLGTTGTVTAEYLDTTSTLVRKSGELTIDRYASSSAKLPSGTVPFFSYDGATLEAPFYSQTITDINAHPISYNLSISNHGVALVVWLEASDSFGDKFSWFCVQHLVDTSTGSVAITSKCPVFCLYSIGGGKPFNTPQTPVLDAYKYSEKLPLPLIYRFTVRESDVLRPTVPVCAGISTVDSNAVINPYQQVSIYENKTFALTMPNNFNSDRYVYKEEMDMILYTSADVISQWNKVSLSMFGKTREYTAMHSNISNNAGMRILLLTKEV